MRIGLNKPNEFIVQMKRAFCFVVKICRQHNVDNITDLIGTNSFIRVGALKRAVCFVALRGPLGVLVQCLQNSKIH